MTKLILGFVFGAASGVLGVLFVQSMSKTDPAGDPDAVVEAVPVKLERDLALAEAKVAKLEKQNEELNRKLSGTGAVAAIDPVKSADGAKKPGDSGKKSLIEMMMELGSTQEKRKAEDEVAQLAGRLDLTEAQAEEALAAMLEKLERQQKAGIKLLSGEASLADLMASDEDDFTAFDAAMSEILNEQQQAEYAAVQEEREIKRVEKKTIEDMQGLEGAVDLTEEQKDLAWDVFVKINAEDKPGGAPPDLTLEDFGGFVDEQIDKRLELLQPILNQDQHSAYQVQADGFKEMVMQLVTSGVRESGDDE